VPGADLEIFDHAARIELAAFDVDGVMTDGRIILGPDACEYKAFNVREVCDLIIEACSRCGGRPAHGQPEPRSGR
jgi:3-deoxy-D-manno-octulosonate 8-phosphate phosphatase KdsC-like HAD superfamily phosphatase